MRQRQNVEEREENDTSETEPPKHRRYTRNWDMPTKKNPAINRGSSEESFERKFNELFAKRYPETAKLIAEEQARQQRRQR